MNKENLKPICHLLGGLLIIVIAFQFFEKEILNLSIVYIILGCLLLIVAGLNKWIEKHIKKFSVLFFLIEAGAFYYASKNQLEAEDSIVHSMLVAATYVYILLALFFLFTKNSSEQKHSKKRRGRSSSGSSRRHHHSSSNSNNGNAHQPFI